MPTAQHIGLQYVGNPCCRLQGPATDFRCFAGTRVGMLPLRRVTGTNCYVCRWLNVCHACGAISMEKGQVARNWDGTVPVPVLGADMAVEGHAHLMHCTLYHRIVCVSATLPALYLFVSTAPLYYFNFTPTTPKCRKKNVEMCSERNRLNPAPAVRVCDSPGVPCSAI